MILTGSIAFIELQFNEYVLISQMYRDFTYVHIRYFPDRDFVEYPLKKPKSFRNFVTNGKSE